MKRAPIVILSAIFLIAATLGVFFYTNGYKFDLDEKEITTTGMIAVKSIPDGAQVFLDGILTTATNNTIQGLKPGKYKLRVQKTGFVVWEKEVEVYEQLVTDITAVLVSKTPRLEPLTSSGARGPIISPTLSKVAYFTKDGDTPGIWIFPLGGNVQINLFKSSPGVLLKDTPKVLYSNGQAIEWSPDEREILVKMAENNFLVASLDGERIQSTSSAEPTKKKWNQEVSKKRELFLSRVAVPEELASIAMDVSTIWSPDELKFLYTEKKDGMVNFNVYDLERPLPVGEKASYTTFSVKEGDPLPKVFWYSDSFHLILVENYKVEDKSGTISMIRIDGTNKTELFNNNLFSDTAFPTPGGDKIVILTSFKSDSQPDLYAIGIR